MNVKHFGFVAAVGAGLMASVPSRGALIGEYNFEDNATGSTVADTSGSGAAANGTFQTQSSTGSPKPTFSNSTSVVGAQSLALTNLAYVDLNSGTVVTSPGGNGNLPGTTPAKYKAISTAMTLSGWVNLVGPVSGYNTNGEPIISSSTPTSQVSRGFTLDVNGGAGGVPRFQIATSSTTLAVVSGTAAVSAGTWHLITGVYDGTATTPFLNIYMDGVLQGTTTTGVTATMFNNLSLNNASLNLGTSGAPPVFSASAFVTGNLDDVRIYDNALTAPQVLALYTSAVPEPASMCLLLAGASLLIRRRSQCIAI